MLPFHCRWNNWGRAITLRKSLPQSLPQHHLYHCCISKRQLLIWPHTDNTTLFQGSWKAWFIENKTFKFRAVFIITTSRKRYKLQPSYSLYVHPYNRHSFLLIQLTKIEVQKLRIKTKKVFVGLSCYTYT